MVHGGEDFWEDKRLPMLAEFRCLVQEGSLLNTGMEAIVVLRMETRAAWCRADVSRHP
jgi:hypothetical protein